MERCEMAGDRIGFRLVIRDLHDAIGQLLIDDFDAFDTDVRPRDVPGESRVAAGSSKKGCSIAFRERIYGVGLLGET